MTRIPNTPVKIDGTLRLRFVPSVVGNYGSFQEFFKDYDLSVVRDRDIDTIKPEYELFKAGYSIQGVMTSNPKVTNYSDLPFSKFQLQLFKNDKFLLSSEYQQGYAHRVDPRTKSRLKMFWGRPTYDQRVACERSHPSTPTLANVFYSIMVDASCVDGYTFVEFCDSFGYDTDSMKANQLYMACQETLTKIRPHMEELQEILKDF